MNVGGYMSKFTTQYLVCPPVASRSAVHRLRIDHTRLSIMARVEYCPTLREGQCGVMDIAGIRDALPYLTIQNIPNVLYGRLVWRIDRPREDWDVFSFQKRCAYSGNLRPAGLS